MGNGGSGSMKTITVLEDDPLTLHSNLFTKNNDSFVKWNTESNGKGKSYPDNYRFSKYDLGQNLVLYAIWDSMIL